MSTKVSRTVLKASREGNLPAEPARLRSDAGDLATVTIRLYRCDSLTAKPGPDEGPGRVSRRIHKDRILTTRRRCRCNSYPGGEPVMQLPQYAA